MTENEDGPRESGTDQPGMWQPIDDVPKDEDVLVYTAQWGTIIAQLSSEFDEWLSRMQVPVTMAGEGDRPTHWQKLPPPPEGAGGG